MSPSIGDRLGGYELVAALEEGGMSTLYLGRRRESVNLPDEAALKVLNPDFAEIESFTQMFEDEAHITMRVVHPNVIRVLCSGVEEGVCYLVMEYLPGCSLAEMRRALRVAERQLPVPFAVSIARQVALGLHAAHETRDVRGRPADIIHRDVGPRNIRVTTAGQVKLLDFGIAKARERLQNTQRGMVKGTMRYMSPEQARAEPVDRRTDIYSLGVVLWEMLVGKRMVDAKSDYEVMEQLTNPHPVPPSLLRDGISAELNEVLGRAITPQPEGRFPDAASFAKALAAVPDAGAVQPSDLADLLAELVPDRFTPPGPDGFSPIPRPEQRDPEETPTLIQRVSSGAPPPRSDPPGD